tara:strand:+ start:4596 stop:4988 length:393 start_codon:yes stop_codon:yes gene_type:complete
MNRNRSRIQTTTAVYYSPSPAPNGNNLSGKFPEQLDNLSVKNLEVTGTLTYGGRGGNDKTELEELKIEMEALKMKMEKIVEMNAKLETIIKNLKLEDLVNVDTDGRREDGAFLGWAGEENVWVPFPEIGT